MGITAPGLGSSLDVNGIVSQLMAVERQPLALLDRRESDYKAKLSAYGTLKGALSAFQSAMQGLADPSQFQAAKASSGDSSMFAATTSTNGKAVPGSYSVEVQQLAQQQKVSSEGFGDINSMVGSGTLAFQYGNYDSGSNIFTLNSQKSVQTVTIDPSNSTLSGVRDAINAADIGISATIINDGSSNRLVLTSKDAGASNSIKIMVSDDDGANLDTSGLSRLAFDPAAAAGAGKNLAQAQAAQDARLQIDGIAISKSSNTITDAIEGVTLNLLKSNAGSPVSLEVARDSAGIKASVEAFVKSYNAVNQTLADLSSYNTAADRGGVLQGDSAALSIQRWLRATVSASVGNPGGNPGGSLTSLSQIGVAFQKDGSLALDAARLQTAADAGLDQIASLFAARGKPADSLIAYQGASARTAAGNYAIEITRLAAMGSLMGSQPAGLAITAGVNDQFNITIDGVAASVTLAAGVYASADALAAEVHSKLNGAANLATAGISAVVSQSAGVINITSSRYGSASSVTLSGGNGAADLLGASPTATQGTDVAGTINGVAAMGTGQLLTAVEGEAAEGLRLIINGGPLGARGVVEFSRGYADRLNKLAEDLLANDGIIATRLDGINASIKDIDRRQEDFIKRLDMTEARYRAQFTALDVMLSSLNQTSQFLQQQLATLPKNNSNS